MMKTLLDNSVLLAVFLCAGSMFGCSTFEREQSTNVNPVTGIVTTNLTPSQAEQVLQAVMAANKASAPVNPFSEMIQIVGSIAGAFLAGYGGAHVRVKRNEPINELVKLVKKE